MDIFVRRLNGEIITNETLLKERAEKLAQENEDHLLSKGLQDKVIQVKPSNKPTRQDKRREKTKKEEAIIEVKKETKSKKKIA